MSPRPHSGELGAARGPPRGVSSQRRPPPPSGTSAAAWSFSPAKQRTLGPISSLHVRRTLGEISARAGGKGRQQVHGEHAQNLLDPSGAFRVPRAGVQGAALPRASTALRNPGEAHGNPDGLGVWTGTDLRHRRSPAGLGTMPFPPPCVIRAGTGAELTLSRAIMRVKRSACCRPRTCPATVLSDAQGPGLVSSTKDATWDTDSLSWVSEPQKS